MTTNPHRSGGCQCGAVRFKCPRTPRALYVCHCRECQRQSSSAFGISFIVKRDDIQLEHGTPVSFTRTTDSGGEMECTFCRDCGTRLWHVRSRGPRSASVKAGTLDEPVSVNEAVHIWTDRKLAGVIVPAAAEQWPGEPVD